MREMIFNVSGVIAPVALCVLVGFALAKAELTFDNRMVGSPIATVDYPTLILSDLAAHDLLVAGVERQRRNSGDAAFSVADA